MQLRTLPVRYSVVIALLIVFLLALPLGATPFPGPGEEEARPVPEPAPPLAAALGVRFMEGSKSKLIMERDGKEYLVDLEAQTIVENNPPQVAAAEAQQTPAAAGAASGATIFRQQCTSCHGDEGKGLAAAATPDLTNFRARSGITTQRVIDAITNGKSGTAMPAFSGKLTAAQINDVALFVQSLPAQPAQSNIYEPADDFVFSLPTGRSVPKGSLFVNFSHRFAYNPAFSGPGLGNIALGWDGFSLSSFGLRYGITDKLSVNVFRSPSIIGRPIEFMGAFNVLDEQDGHPLNAALRVSVQGQDNFRRNYTTNFEAVVSRSITRHAQLYVVPTYSINNRRLITKPGALPDRVPELPGFETWSIGAGLAVNIRPTVAIVTEVIPTVKNGDELGIHRPSYALGIQKRVRGHSFTLGVSQGPGTTVAQRAGTRATLVNNPSADKPSGLFFGFNLMRQLR